jgi:hypothetical protein
VAAVRWERPQGLGRGELGARGGGTWLMSFCLSTEPTERLRSQPAHPSRPVSSDRHAFWNDSWKVRPNAIVSPTDFICGAH